jgi:PLP dependent protein
LSEITVIAVTKTVPAPAVMECIQAGIKDIGENRVQEAEGKFSQVEGLGLVRKHLIGHLQTNKAKKAVELFDLIQSIDSERLAAEINKQAEKTGKVQDCLLEIKVSEEESKFGVVPGEAGLLTESVKKFGNIRLRGIMGMAPYFDKPENARPYFAELKKIFEQLKQGSALPAFDTLSMGMSNDFEIAVEEGATMLRIGTAIFK